MDAAVLRLFMQGIPVSERAIRGALISVVDRAERRYSRLGKNGETEIEKQVEEARRSISAYDPFLLAFNTDPRPTRAIRTKRAERRRGLQDATALLADLVLHDETAPAGTVVEWLRLMGLEQTADSVEPGLIAEELGGGAGVPLGSLAFTRGLARDVPFGRLCAARWVAALWGFINLHLVVGLIGDDAAGTLLRELDSDEGTQWFRWAIGIPVNPTQIVSALLTLAGSTVFLEVGWEYAKALLPIISVIAANAVRDAPGATESIVSALMQFGEIELGELPSDNKCLPLDSLEAAAKNALHSAGS
jgi:hypothetical protein